MSVRVPHLALPLTFRSGRPVVLEQDSPEEIAQAVRSVLAFRPGERIELPEFGLADPTFGESPPDLDAFREAIERWEPRALALVEIEGELDPETLAALMARVRVQIGAGEED